MGFVNVANYAPQDRINNNNELIAKNDETIEKSKEEKAEMEKMLKEAGEIRAKRLGKNNTLVGIHANVNIFQHIFVFNTK